MVAESFISRKIKFKGNIAAVATAVSFFVIIVAVAVSSGFRHSIRDGVAAMTGDIKITPYVSGGQDPVPMPRHLPSEDKILAIPGVSGIVPVVTRAGIVKSGEIVHGVIVKGIPDQVGDDGSVMAGPDRPSLAVSIPHRLQEITGLGPGEDLTTYFVGEKVRARKFHITDVHRDIIETDDNLLVYAGLEDMQRLNGWDSTMVSQLEVRVKNASPNALKDIEARIGFILATSPDEDENGLYVVSSARSYPQIFDWLGLLDMNVVIILILMTLVAGFNMISGLLVMLLRNIPLIGTLKAMGMQDGAIGRLFVRMGSEAVLKGMLVGNLLAFLFCLIQGTTHLIKLDPANYFVSWVPVHLPFWGILGADIAAFAGIVLLMWLPALSISKIDPAQTVRAD
ncbi:MAG: ABC transporter permease [Bacteroidales bacterium]|nr:ABC transporter permease [Bacteroidales bacterium]